ncbi:DNA mismatch repair protein MutL [Aliidiomarina shirensis]|uniref:DNA mismatch repair protein MutL n=1 Tax=Aliidiomarina shirensis TaxID=1048642 RepID=A0A432WV51_9GAMM|nr:DNA mismatch repair endonuclease MutL [Aliidiomarina shirensis]RUO37651.1 DNA mismatch repair protein MutL [Aliidiomarina shirensis]
MAIRLLPPQLANQIAAGEVVERPASVVKELVENCIDAGATELRIDIEKGGARRIRIRDNGSGIPKDELELALSRHATSKIATLDDLEAIHSLGFRGEALASISSVSRLRLSSKPADQTEAWQAWCEGRDMQVTLEPTSHPNGTTVDVQDLFFNTPARRKFLRTEKTEFGHIDEVVRRIALACPEVDIQLNHNQQLLRHYPSANTDQKLLSRLRQIAGKRFADEALHIEWAPEANDEHAVAIRGWIAPPQACRHQTDVQYMYVNGRMMKDKLLNHAVRQAYGDSLSNDRQATYILYITLPANDVDVNVHPAKHEVRFQHARQVHDFVLLQIRQALAPYISEQQHAYEHHYEYTKLTPKHEVAPEPASKELPQQSSITPATSGRSILPGAFRGTATKPSSEQLKEQQAYQSLYATRVPEVSTKDAGDSALESVRGSEFNEAHKLLSLLADRWALMQAGDELTLLDIQQAHLRVQTQRIRQQLIIGLSGQPLLVPVQLKVERAEILNFPAVLSRCGLLFEQKRLRGDQYQLTIKQVPEALRKGDLGQTIPKLLAILADLVDSHKNHEKDAFAQKLSDSNLADWLATQALKSEYSIAEAKQWLQLIQQSPNWQKLLRPLNWRNSFGADKEV